MVARRTTQIASQIMFRLHTLYQPGGSAEKALLLNHLQNPGVIQDVVSGVSALRARGRWHKGWIDCGMVAPLQLLRLRRLPRCSMIQEILHVVGEVEVQAVREGRHASISSLPRVVALARSVSSRIPRMSCPGQSSIRSV